MNTKNCPCGSNQVYENCCKLFIDQQQFPSTPEQLMRSRYTAFTQVNIDYIEQTMRGSAAKNFDHDETKKWAQQVEWTGLEVLNTSAHAKNLDKGTVEFVARFRWNNKEESIHEISQFEKIKDHWYYVGQIQTRAKQNTPVLGRNDPCFCGSGKKYKKCCLGTN